MNKKVQTNAANFDYFGIWLNETILSKFADLKNAKICSNYFARRSGGEVLW